MDHQQSAGRLCQSEAVSKVTPSIMDPLLLIEHLSEIAESVCVICEFRNLSPALPEL